MATPRKKVATRLCRGKGVPLLNCIGEVKEIEFYSSWSDFEDDKVCYCKKCCNKIYDNYIKDGHDELSALYFTLQKIDIPFISSIYDSLSKSGKNININNYVSIIHGVANNSKKEYYKDFSYSDTDLTTISTRAKNIKNNIEDTNKFLLDWGYQDSIEDYQFLEYRYDVYTENKDLIPAQETLYRKLCLAELSARRKEAVNESTKDETEQILKLMSKLKIDNFEEKKAQSDIDKILEKQIWEIENTEPSEMVDKEEYKDYLDIGKNWGQHILRAVKNLIVGSRDYPNITKD